MTRKEQLKAIRTAYDELAMLNLQDGFYEVERRLLDMNMAAERQHRRGAPNGIAHGLTVKDAAKLFTVSHLLDGWNDTYKWSVEDILRIRTECLYAQAYAKRHHAELADWAAKWTRDFAGVDYAELQQVAPARAA
jgi:hypothetical protein